MLLGSVITNVQLKHFGIKTTNKCTFCEQSVETLYHLFWDCIKIQGIWQWFISETDSELSFENVLLSNSNLTQKINNTLLLVAKHYIYHTKCANETINVKTFLNYCIEIKNLEEKVPYNKNNQNTHNTKWDQLEMK